PRVAVLRALRHRLLPHPGRDALVPRPLPDRRRGRERPAGVTARARRPDRPGARVRRHGGVRPAARRGGGVRPPPARGRRADDPAPLRGLLPRLRERARAGRAVPRPGARDGGRAALGPGRAPVAREPPTPNPTAPEPAAAGRPAASAAAA